MRKLVKWAVVTLGIAALVRWRRARRAEPEPAPAAERDPAEELRLKLAESRGDADAPETSESPGATVEERRAEVHEQARTTLSEMAADDSD